MTSEELLRTGIAAAKAGDIEQASKLLIQVVQTDPSSEMGWLWLGVCRKASDQREYCFRRVLALNSQNAEARRQLELLHRPSDSSRQARPLAAQDAPVRGPALSTAEPPRGETLVNRQSPGAMRSRSRRKSSRPWIWAAGIALTIMACVSIAGVVVFSGILNLATTYTRTRTLPSPTSLPASPTPGYTAVFEAGPCNFTTPVEARVDCGYVIVPEDRSGDPFDTIRLAVIVYRSTSNAPLPDPILYLSGGPGGEAIEWSVSVYDSVIAPLLSNRDFIVFDPRGVGRSEPALECDEFGKTYLQDLQGKIPPEQRVSYYEGALLGCKNSLVQLGANLSAYTSADMAADARDVILALGYSQANLYGVSYGTRVAQFVMRAHSEVVRTAILDSVVPVEVRMLSQSSIGFDDALHLMFEDCHADPACSEAYPDLESAYKQVFDRLNVEPARVTITLPDNRKIEQSINGYTFENTLMWALRTPQTIPLAPRLIYSVRDGDHSLLLLSLALPILAFDSVAMGSYISVNCHDQVFAMPVQYLDQTVYSMCQLWDVRPPAPGENDPVNSAIPTLIFAGRYDSTTPPAFAHQLAGHLTHSYVAEIPDQGHAPSVTGVSDCPAKVVSAFLQDPNTAPDLTCVQEIPKTKFVVPFNPNAPIVLAPVTVEEYQLSTLSPAGWTPGDYGFYNRGGFLGDIAQIGIQRAAVLESEWLTWLSTNFRGNKGFDQPAVKQGERQANGLTWSIYKTSSEGHPVDVALAASGDQTLLVLLISYQAEREALYNTAFLPIVDSTIPVQ